MGGKEEFATLLNPENIEKWQLQKNLFQEIKANKLTSLIKSGERKSTYKLVLNNIWNLGTKVDFENQGINGAFSLVKITWKGYEMSEGGKWLVDEIKVNDNNKVWLIMAQGTKGIYLMPVVRASWRWSEDGCSTNIEKDNAGKQVNGSGVADIKNWTFDKSKEWRSQQDDKIKESMKSGFSITRTVETAIFGKEGKAIEWDWNRNRSELKGGLSKEGAWFLSKNAGVLNLEEMNKKAWSCRDVEYYFPLDLFEISNAKGKLGPTIEIKGNNQTITINDTISEVIGVRLNRKRGLKVTNLIVSINS